MSQTIRCIVSVSALCVLSTTGCKDKTPPTPKTSPKTTPSEISSSIPKFSGQHVMKKPLEAQAVKIIDSITALEKSKDVTCWTSFRQLDSFIATKQYSELATLTKVSASTSLVYHLWNTASMHAAEKTISKAELIKVFDAAPLNQYASIKRDGLSDFAQKLGMKEFKDYRKTSEHWRIILSVLFDELSRPATTLTPLSPEALEALAEITTKLSLILSRDAGQHATQARSPLIEPTHVLTAYESLAKAMGVKKPVLHRVSKRETTQNRTYLHKLTGMMIRGKVNALLSYNKERNLLTALNAVSRVPMNVAAVKIMTAQLQSFARFVALGYEPMRQDNYLADGSFAASELDRRAFIDPFWAQNTVMQLFPHALKPNGDIVLHFEPNPAIATATKRSPKTMTLLDYEQNGVRDSAMHWLVLNNVFKQSRFIMDPFAAEYLSEVLSMIMTYYIRRGQVLAKAQGKKVIDAEIAKQVRDRAYVQVNAPEHRPVTWSKAKQEQKQKLLKTLPRQLFVDATKQAGLPDVVTKLEGDLSSQGLKQDIQRVMGSGLAVGDVNGDGFVDMFIAGESMARLYVNRGAKQPGVFDDRTKAYGIDSPMHDSRGALFFDMEGDGDLDLLVVRSGHPTKLYEQNDGKFTDVAKSKLLVTHNGAHVAHIFDADGDGDLDIYIGYYGNHLVNTNKSKARNLPTIDGRNSSPNQLWIRQDNGTYINQAERAGIADTGWTLAVGTFDFDGDHLPDLYLANDFGANRLFKNKGKGTFEDISSQTKTDDRGSGMNVSVSDVNADGRFDLYLSNIDMFSKSIKVVFPKYGDVLPIKQDLLKSFQYITGNKLYMGPRTGSSSRVIKPWISEEQTRFEPGDRGWAWDGNFFDYDLDGDEDMYLSNGWIPKSYANQQANQLFINDGKGVFFLTSSKDPAAFKANSRAVASVDVDNDGDLDLIVTNFWGAPRLLLNMQSLKNNWLKVCPQSKTPNRHAWGARVEVKFNGRTLLRQMSGGRGYLSQDDPACAHFGVADAKSVQVRVQFGPTLTVSKSVKTNQRVTVSLSAP